MSIKEIKSIINNLSKQKAPNLGTVTGEYFQKSLERNYTKSIGSFGQWKQQIIDEEETQFMSNCPVAVTESTPRRRTRIQVFWIAPPTGTGCVILKASIVQKRIIYFQDEGSLTKKLCEQDPTLDGVTDRPILDCCACGTAKYRLTFYGNWSEKTHPKDYP
ncbi:hypothetical protein STEG23_004008, partial [Scotinomys teguina]